MVLKALGINAMVFFRVQKKVQGEARPSPNRGQWVNAKTVLAMAGQQSWRTQ
jgi:hypothetical protein